MNGIAGQKTRFHLELGDEYGNALTRSNEYGPVAVRLNHLEGDAIVNSTVVVEEEDGTLQVDCIPNLAGVYAIQVWISNMDNHSLV